MKKMTEQIRRIVTGVLIISMVFSSGLSFAAPSEDSSVYNGQSEERADFEMLRSRWKTLLTGGDSLDTGHALVQDYAASIRQLGGEHWNSLIKLGGATEDNRTCLFPDLPLTDKSTKTGSSQITLTFDRLKAIVLAYETKDSGYYKDPEVKAEIIAGLDMMVSNHYSLYYATSGTGTSVGGGTKSFGNWYDWRIGTPRQFCDLLLMFYDELTDEQLNRYIEPIMANNKRVDTTGANRTWIANIFIQCGVLAGDGERISAGKTGVKDVFKFVAQGDGFHKDGSFIQHTYYAYTGGYGKALLCTMAPMMYVLNGSGYEIAYEDNCEQIFYDMLFEAYEPLIYGGRFMDMAREREISRVANQDDIPGRQAIRSMIMLTEVLPADQRERAEAMIKEWLSDEEVLAQVCIDPIGGFNEYYLPAGVIGIALDILNSGTEARGNLVLHKRFGAMDRVVHLRDDFGYTISMSSNRIRNTEGTNEEGMRLWHIGDGLTYLYNQDKAYYSDHYWATVDYQRLPGTTVNRYPGRVRNAAYNTANPYKYAGGTDLGEYGIAGLEIQGVGSGSRDGAHAKKSWFMFDDEVVALGSDIRSTLAGSQVETTVENRKINLDKSNLLTVDGVVQELIKGGEPEIKSNKAIAVKTVTSNKNIVASRELTGVTANTATVVEFKIKMPEATDFFAVKLYGSGDGNESKEIAMITMRGGAFVPRVTTDNRDAYNEAALTGTNEWHDVKIELDMANQSYNYYFDGVHIKAGTKSGTGMYNGDITNLAFRNSLTGGNHTLSMFEIMAPGSRNGSIMIDDISISQASAVRFEQDFEGFEADDHVAAMEGWTVAATDPAATAKVFLEQETFIPEDDDAFNKLHEKIKWIHLAGKTSDSDVGYYFPGTADINGLRETRTGSWDLVNTYEKFTDTEERINSFVTFWFAHGVTPDKEAYSYVVLPGKNAEETAAYEANPDIEILSQTEQIHAVRENSLKITGVNFFEAGKFSFLRVEQAACVMYQENQEDGTMELSFADPTQTAATLSLEVALPVLEVVECDEEVQVELVNGLTVFKAVPADTPLGNAGKSFTVKVKLAEKDNMFENIDEGETPAHWEVIQGRAVVVAEDNGNHVLEISSSSSASTELEYPEGGAGSVISFAVKFVSGTGNIRLGSGQETPVVLTEEPFSDGKWHYVRVKINPVLSTCQIMIDGALYGKAQEYTGDSPGDFIIATNAGGVVQLDNLVVYEASNIAPTQPKGLTYTGYGDTYVALRWDASESDNPVHYLVSVNGTELDKKITETAYTVGGLTPAETYEFTVQAVDDEDNYSDMSDELMVTLLERQMNAYVIDFNHYELGAASQNRWVYSGTDSKGILEIRETPAEKSDDSLDGMMTDLEYWRGKSGADTAGKAGKATPSDAEPATPSNARLATPSNITPAADDSDKVLYVYSGTNASGVDKNASYSFEPQTEAQTYRMKVYFDSSMKYTNFALMGSNGNQAATMIIHDDGSIGYRTGEAPSTTIKLIDGAIENEWIDFAVTADPKTQTYSISANGIEARDLQFRWAASDISKIAFNAPGGGTGGFYIDDIVLPADNSFQKLELKEIEDDLSEILTVQFGTDFYDLDLPESLTVKAITAGGEEEYLEIRVNWSREDYDAKKAGTYTIHGTLAYPSNCINKIADNKIKMKVEVEKEIKIYTISLVQSAGGTISSSADTAEEGAAVTLSADPDDGYGLSGWRINGRDLAASGESYTFELKSDVIASAVFEATAVEPEDKYYTVTVASGIIGGSVTASSGYAKQGTEITLTAKPKRGYALESLTVNGRKVEVDASLTYVFELTANTKVTAVFKGSGTNSGSSGEGVYSNISVVPSYATKGSWKKVGDSWQFLTDTGEPLKSDWAYILWDGGYEWYYFDKDGIMSDGWLRIEGRTYYLLPMIEQGSGRMVTGWQLIEGKWYYFNAESDGTKGVLLTNTKTPDGYLVDKDGVWVK